MTKRNKRKFVRWGLISGNVILLLGVGIFILINRSASQTIRSSTVNSVVTTASSLHSPLDTVSSAQIALEVAQMTDLPELTAVRNQTDSENAQLAVAASDTSIVAKPQLVDTGLKSKKDIVEYTTKASDTVSGIAATFGLNPNSIRWSNGLSGDAIEAGRTILIPPANGIVYQVKSGDTIDGVVNKYRADRAVFVTVNDAEGGSLTVGERVWVAGGVLSAPAPRFSSISSGFSGTVSGSRKFGSCGVKIPGVSGAYDCGYCTWWSAYRRYQVGNPIPGGLGNAITWASRAAARGLVVNDQPKAGAAIWFRSNHVGFVEKVNEDGSVLVSEMNRAGWDVMNYRTLSASQAASYRYIH